jgi:hypothetical protein
MTEPLPNSFLYEHCDVPDGESLSDWRARKERQPQRRAQVTGGLIAAVATLAPIVFSVRGSRSR